MMTSVKVKGMSCQHCVKRVTEALQALPGVKKVKVDLDQERATFDKPEKVTMSQVQQAIKSAGYEVVQE